MIKVDKLADVESIIPKQEIMSQDTQPIPQQDLHKYKMDLQGKVLDQIKLKLESQMDHILENQRYKYLSFK